ncbi:cytoplasmic dynein 1 light intermediate chain 2-like [Anopheles moucheti]|uniref:cytoplasmic dynein 1 light intermediate chain 2-like n=1 Tax=Anopheles moucheti TaxID=186751 RepID=UPI0022F06E21|nr:cytoplasmic dynein 1 light intermediate chain 2-like [Anopheles moucheti]
MARYSEGRNYWASLFQHEMGICFSALFPPHKYVLVLGDSTSGKSSLIAKLNKENPKKCSGLEYYRIAVVGGIPCDYLTFWVLDDDGSRHKEVLKCVLREQTFPHTLVMLVISMDTPWNWMEQLQRWMNRLTEHIAGLMIHPAEKQRCQARLTTAWQKYCETIDEPNPGVSPLPEGVLMNNLGLDLVIVVTKTDYMITLEQQFDFQREHFDFMQRCERRFCLTYGASLIYTSAKEDKNCDLLQNYLMHRLYGLPLRTSALVVEKDAVLIPAGWDNISKINLLNENIHSFKPDDCYNDVITLPASEKTGKKREDEVPMKDIPTLGSTNGGQSTAFTETPEGSSKKKNQSKTAAASSTVAEGTYADDLQNGSSSHSTFKVQSCKGGSSDLGSTSDQTNLHTEDTPERDPLAGSCEKD